MTNEKRPALKQRPWDQGGESAPSFGSWLRRQRELREITLREIADSTKISLRYLEALEEDRFDALPAPLFARGFLREYAKYVGLNADEVVNHYLFALQALEPDEKADDKVQQSRTAGQWTYALLFVLALVALVGLVAFAAFWVQKRHGRSEEPPPPIAAPVQPAAPAAVVTQAPAPAPEVAGAPLRVALDFRRDCWVEASVDGEQKVSELRVQGESLQLEAQREIVLTLGNASAVALEVNGAPYQLPGNPGEVVRDLVLRAPGVEAPAGPGAATAAPRRPGTAPLPVGPTSLPGGATAASPGVRVGAGRPARRPAATPAAAAATPAAAPAGAATTSPGPHP